LAVYLKSLLIRIKPTHISTPSMKGAHIHVEASPWVYPAVRGSVLSPTGAQLVPCCTLPNPQNFTVEASDSGRGRRLATVTDSCI